MKKTFAIAVLGSALLLSGCGTPTPTATTGYTGKAIIDRSYRNSSKSGCKVVVKLPNGQTDTLSVGRRTTCTGWDAGKTITITNGRLNK